MHLHCGVTYVEFKILKFLTLRKVTKSPENFVQDAFSITLTKVCHKNWCEGLT